MTSPGSSMGGAGFRSLPALAWTAGVKTTVIASPNTEWSITVPTGELWQIQTVQFQFTTSAAVANRLPTLLFQLATGEIIGEFWHVVPQGGSLERFYNFIDGFPVFEDVAIPAHHSLQNPLVGPLLQGGDIIKSLTLAMDPADTYGTVQVIYKKFLNVSQRLSFL